MIFPLLKRATFWGAFGGVVGGAFSTSYLWASFPCIKAKIEGQPLEQSGEQACYQFLDLLAPLFSATAVNAFGTAAIAVFTWRLYKATNRLWDAGRDQITVARGAADAAKISATYLRLGDRPFINLVDPKLQGIDDHLLGIRSHAALHFGLENIGKGAGFILSYGIAHEICPDKRQGSATSGSNGSVWKGANNPWRTH